MKREIRFKIGDQVYFEHLMHTVDDIFPVSGNVTILNVEKNALRAVDERELEPVPSGSDYIDDYEKIPFE